MLFVGQVVGQEFSLANFPSWVFLILITLFLIVILIFVMKRAKSGSLLKSAKKYRKERLRLLKDEIRSLEEEDVVVRILKKIKNDPALRFILDEEIAANIPDKIRKRIEWEQREISRVSKKGKRIKMWCLAFYK